MGSMYDDAEQVARMLGDFYGDALRRVADELRRDDIATGAKKVQEALDKHKGKRFSNVEEAKADLRENMKPLVDELDKLDPGNVVGINWWSTKS